MDEDASFNECLEKYHPSKNPNLGMLYEINDNSRLSFLPELKGKYFPYKSRAPHLRQIQDEDLSMQSVQRGVEKVRSGESCAAVQHFNTALSLHEKNVEAYVGRAAAYANMGRFNMAETDLERALSMQPQHSNARAYMVETLLEGAKRLVEEGNINEARMKYEKVLRLKEDVRAREGLQRLEESLSTEKNKVDDGEVQILGSDEEKKKRKESEKEKKRRKKVAEQLAEMERFIARLKEDKI